MRLRRPTKAALEDSKEPAGKAAGSIYRRRPFVSATQVVCVAEPQRGSENDSSAGGRGVGGPAVPAMAEAAEAKPTDEGRLVTGRTETVDATAAEEAAGEARLMTGRD